MAQDAEGHAAAQADLDEAIKILGNLISQNIVRDLPDDYPLVTMSEGHTIVVRALEGDEAARLLAREYVKSLEREGARIGSDSRMAAAYRRLLNYAATGFWDGSKTRVEQLFT